MLLMIGLYRGFEFCSGHVIDPYLVPVASQVMYALPVTEGPPAPPVPAAGGYPLPPAAPQPPPPPAPEGFACTESSPTLRSLPRPPYPPGRTP